MSLADIRRVVASAALVAFGIPVLGSITNHCTRNALLEFLSLRPPEQPMPACNLAVPGAECPFGFEHCLRTGVEEWTFILSMIVLFITAGALASRGSKPSLVRGGITVGVGAAVPIAIDASKALSLSSILAPSLAFMLTAALFGVAGGYAAKAWPNKAFKGRRAKRARP